MTLRAKLVLTVLGLVAIALVVSDIASSATLRSYLLRQTDIRLRAARVPVARRVTPPATTTNGATRPQLISDFFIQVRAPDGTVLNQLTPTVRDTQDPLPDLSQAVVSAHIGKVPFTVGAIGKRSFDYRVIATRASNGDTLIAAISLRDVNNTINRLRMTELIVTTIVLLTLAAATWWIIRIELRQLDTIARTADSIAAGDLSRRVSSANSKTEVGRLSEAFNAMLSQIEASFTERQLSEERLRRFATDASHELRTPLTAIRGYAELYRQGAIHDDEHLARVLRRIESESTRMGLMVDDLLLLARLDQRRPMDNEQVDIATLVDDVVNDSRVIAEDRSIELTNDTSEAVVSGDSARLHQVFSNLIGNALVHTPPQSPIHITVTSRDQEVIVDVKDEGPGLPEGAETRVFERFYREDAGRSRHTGGTGLGLAIVKSIVDSHGGNVSVRSKSGEGACFSVHLPLASSFTASPQP